LEWMLNKCLKDAHRLPDKKIKNVDD
jgi:hypothetical protein